MSESEPKRELAIPAAELRVVVVDTDSNDGNNNNNNNNTQQQQDKEKEKEPGKYTLENLVRENLKLKERLSAYQREREALLKEREKSRKNLERARNIILEQKKTITTLQQQQQNKNKPTNVIANLTSNAVASALMRTTEQQKQQQQLSTMATTPTTTNNEQTTRKNDIHHVDVIDEKQLLEQLPYKPKGLGMIKSLSLSSIYAPSLSMFSSYFATAPNNDKLEKGQEKESVVDDSDDEEHHHIAATDKDKILIELLRAKVRRLREKRKRELTNTFKLEKDKQSLEEMTKFYKDKIELMERKYKSPRVMSLSPKTFGRHTRSPRIPYSPGVASKVGNINGSSPKLEILIL
ncbi:hypothetical protein SAMD00019534_108700 [Acytostelium subglobosum LB1]|uniref:hypothetical protein n=1 Tax=Acytostelium subglobosum LB1 TaxID=1410327 RepID=UPI0006452045|nr:hypothetical protein SAMD00019534_108700 [Acytostelium subglobosum LB1]GAM27694.1 hypothetical protein SAMD00019534_108700 [Acytostelium subglobosum LB1]|eukprot:XP_012749353.1 hypothetical protein SAMD00019534_108700 [Acytostelium subglobosum LB1]